MKPCTSVFATTACTSIDQDIRAEPRSSVGTVWVRIHVHLRSPAPPNALLLLRAECYLCVPSSDVFPLAAAIIVKSPSFPSIRSGCMPRCHSIRSLVVSESARNFQTLKYRFRGPSLTCRRVHAYACRSLAPRASIIRTRSRLTRYPANFTCICSCGFLHFTFHALHAYLRMRRCRALRFSESSTPMNLWGRQVFRTYRLGSCYRSLRTGCHRMFPLP